MWYTALSVVTLALCGSVFVVTIEFSYTAQNPPVAHAALAAVCWFFFLLGLATAVLSLIDGEG